MNPKINTPEKPCTCCCHADGLTVLHCFPCCDLCYEKFVLGGGEVDADRLARLIEERDARLAEREDA